MEPISQENDQRRAQGWEGRSDERRNHRKEDSDRSQLCGERPSQTNHGREQEGERQRSAGAEAEGPPVKK